MSGGLSLTLRDGERIVIDHRIIVTARRTRTGNRILLTVQAPPEVEVNREVIELAKLAGPER